MAHLLSAQLLIWAPLPNLHPLHHFCEFESAFEEKLKTGVL